MWIPLLAIIHLALPLVVAKGAGGITLGSAGAILALAAVAGSAISIFLQKGLRDALQTSRDNVDVLLKGRDIDRSEAASAATKAQDELLLLRKQVEALKSDLIKDLVAAAASAAAAAARAAYETDQQPARRTRKPNSNA
jgi:hypothetical protein